MLKETAFVIGGERWADSLGEHQTLTMPSGNQVRVPVFNQNVADQILSISKDLLVNTPIYEIVSFLNAVGQRWKSKEYSRRRNYVRDLQKYLGYSEKMANSEADWIALLLCSHVAMQDTVAVELGNRHILDRWIVNEDSEVKALPRGRVLHILPGNVPISSVVSMLRSILTKNLTIAKMSSEDVFTPMHLALSFRDVNEDHPVSKSVSIVYFQGGLETEEVLSLVKSADAICAWGGQDAIDWAVKSASSHTEIIRFGPRRSLSILSEDVCPKTAADAVAHDISVYNQAACFSTLQLFYLGDPSRFIATLEDSLNLYADTLLPPTSIEDIDLQSGHSLAILEAEFRGDNVFVAEDHSWRVIICEPAQVTKHPRGRTLYIHPIQNIQDVYQYLDPSVQSVSILPLALSLQIRDQLALAGVDRIIELGVNNVFRIGSSHDGVYPLQRMVRFVSHDLPSVHHPKGITFSIEQTTILKEERFLELVP